MKTLFIFLFCGCMLSANQLFAQKNKGNLLREVTITADKNVSSQVHQAFLNKFENAENLRWFQINQNYLVKFIMDDMEHHASFTKKGKLLYYIGYGVEKDLPSVVSKEVKSKYDQYSIGRVFNVNRHGRSIWIVNLESKKDFVVSSIENEEINEISRYKNATGSTSSVAASKTN